MTAKLKSQIELRTKELGRKSVFLTETNNFMTQALFLERGYTGFAIYTITDEDKVYKGKLYLSLKKIYMEQAQPGSLKGEYTFAINNFYSWKQWVRIQSNNDLKEMIEEWRMEKEFQVSCKAMEVLIDEVAMGGNAAISTSKYLIAKDYVTKTRGRPSKAERAKVIKQDAILKNEFAKDLERLKLVH